MSLLLCCGLISFCFSLVSCFCAGWYINTISTYHSPNLGEKKHKINFQLYQNILLPALSKDQHHISIETKNHWQETAIRKDCVECILHSLLDIHIGVSYAYVIHVIGKNNASRGQTLVSVQTLGLQNEAHSEQGCRDGNGGKTSPGLSKDWLFNSPVLGSGSLKLLLTCVLHPGMEEFSLFQSTPDLENWISELQSIVNSSARPRTQSEARMLRNDPLALMMFLLPS